jgi:cell division transport system ATP-binding protein
MIDFRNVSLSYAEGITALRDVSLRIEKGDFVFIVGPTGTGKSSLLKLVYREEKPTSGQVLVAGERVDLIPDSQVWRLRRKVGVVFQDFRLLPDRTVWQNVAFALRVTGASSRKVHKRVPEFLELVGLLHRADSLPGQLSGGEQQRTAIARALAYDAPVLLADEPTGNLDPDSSWEIMQLLDRIHLRGATVAVATHDSGMVDRMRKRVVAIEGGAIVRDEQKARYSAEPD